MHNLLYPIAKDFVHEIRYQMPTIQQPTHTMLISQAAHRLTSHSNALKGLPRKVAVL